MTGALLRALCAETLKLKRTLAVRMVFVAPALLAALALFSQSARLSRAAESTSVPVVRPVCLVNSIPKEGLLKSCPLRSAKRDELTPACAFTPIQPARRV